MDAFITEFDQRLLAERGPDTQAWESLSIRERQAFVCGMRHLKKFTDEQIPEWIEKRLRELSL